MQKGEARGGSEGGRDGGGRGELHVGVGEGGGGGREWQYKALLTTPCPPHHQPPAHLRQIHEQLHLLLTFTKAC